MSYEHGDLFVPSGAVTAGDVLIDGMPVDVGE